MVGLGASEGSVAKLVASLGIPRWDGREVNSRAAPERPPAVQLRRLGRLWGHQGPELGLLLPLVPLRSRLLQRILQQLPLALAPR